MVNNIQQVSDALLCSNCGACIAVCPKNAISISSTTLGRKFASVDDNCIDCGLCLNVCPSLDRQNLRAMHADKYVGEIRNVYVGKSTNREIYNNSQSGGACMSVISYLFDTGAIDAAVLCRMDYGNPPEVKSFLVESKEGLTNYQKSCYTPVDLLSALREATSKKAIAVVGLPCHIQGAESLIRYHHRFHNIRYKIGLICDRTLCAGIQNVMLSVTPPINILKRSRYCGEISGQGNWKTFIMPIRMPL